MLKKVYAMDNIKNDYTDVYNMKDIYDMILSCQSVNTEDIYKKIYFDEIVLKDFE